MLEAFALCFFPFLLAFAGSIDLFTMTIPNRVSDTLVVGFLLFAPLSGMGFYDFSMHIACALVVLCVVVGMFEFGWIGGGDAKMFAAVALWFGFNHVLAFLILASFAGGALMILLLMFRNVPLPLALMGVGWLERLHHPTTRLPYGPAIAAGALLIYPSVPWIAVQVG